MRVVHVVEALGLGGLERVVASLSREASRRFSVEVLALAGGGAIVDELRAAGCRVRCLALRDYYPRSVLRVARALVSGRAEVVHSHGHFAGVAGRLAARLVGVGVVIHHLHTTDDTLGPRHRRLERLLAAVTRRVLCCSNAVARHARQDFGLPDRLLEVVHNGIDPPPHAARVDALRQIGDPAPPVIGCVGPLTPQNGQAVLLRAFAAFTASSGAGILVLLGEGPERDALRSLAGALGMAAQVRFLGARPDVRRLLPAFDLLAEPCLSRESLSLALLEAMDAGVPVVASRLGGPVEVVADGATGLLVPAGDHESMAAAIVSILARPDRGRSLGAAGHQRVEREFRAASMARRIESIYEVALEHVRRAA